MCQSFYYTPQSWTTRRSTEDFANINGFSMMVFIILMALLTHGHGMSFQNRCLGFPKRPCFPKFMKMVAHGAPVTDGLDEFRSLRSEDTKRYKKSYQKGKRMKYKNWMKLGSAVPTTVCRKETQGEMVCS